MKPYLHAKISAKKFGGVPEDYLDIHTWFDHSKGHIADMRHRVILHNSFGIWLCESVFGVTMQKPDGTFYRTSYIINSDGDKVQVRDIGEQHVLDDLGHIPSLERCLAGLALETWMGGPMKKLKASKVALKNLFNGGTMADEDEVVDGAVRPDFTERQDNTEDNDEQENENNVIYQAD